MQREPDFEALLDALPDPMVVLTADLVVRHANSAFTAATGTPLPDLIDRHLIDDVFPDRPGPAAPGRALLRESFHQVITRGVSAVAGTSRYDLVPAGRKTAVARYWSPVNSPILDDTGKVRFILHRVQDVTAARTLLTTLVTTASSLVDVTDPAAGRQEHLIRMAHDLQHSTRLAGDLAGQVAALVEMLDNRALIEQAKGMLMASGRITADQAFALLRSQSQYENRKLRDVAARHIMLHSARAIPPPAGA